MILRDVLEKIAGGRFTCVAGCCGNGGAPDIRCEELRFSPGLLIRLVLGCLMFAAVFILKDIPEPWPEVILMLVGLLAGVDVIAAGVLGVMNGRPFNNCLLVVIAVLAAFALGLYRDGAGAMLMFQLGTVCIGFAFDRTKLSVLSAIECGAECAFVLTSGVENEVPAEQVEVGTQIVIHPGEVVPCDCIVVDGKSTVDISPLCGTAAPIEVSEGDEVLSGSINETGRLRCEVTLKQCDSSAACLIKKVRCGSAYGGAVPPRLEMLVEIFPAAAVVLAVALGLMLYFLVSLPAKDAISRAIMFFVLANPCAIAVAMPLVRLGAAAGASEKGVIFENCGAMDHAAHLSGVALEMTGTVTDGAARVVSVKSSRMPAENLLKLAAHAMAYSSSPYAKSIVASYDGTISIDLVKRFSEVPGEGVEIYLGSIRVCAGSRELMLSKGVEIPPEDVTTDSAVYVSVAEAYAGRILLSESVRDYAADDIKALSACGVEKTVLFTSESKQSAERTAASLGIGTFFSGLSAAQKGETLSGIRSSLEGTLMYIRGAASVASEHSEADIDVCLAASDALTQQTTSDILIFGGRIDAVSTAVNVSRYAERFMQLLAIAVIAAKTVLFILSGFGFITMWFTAFMDAAVSLGAILASIMAYGGELGYRTKSPVLIKQPVDNTPKPEDYDF